MISIFTTAAIKKRVFEGVSFNGVEFVDSKDRADFYILGRSFNNINSEFLNTNSKTIYVMHSLPHNRRVNIRKGYCVDNRVDIPKLKNFCFSFNDFCNIPYIIPMANGPIRYKI